MTGLPPEYWITGKGWRPDANQQFQERAGVDAETGLLTGFQGSVPGEMGLMYQDIHTQATARARQRMMRQGIGYQEGALGLLQSFRPGGGAAAAADAYSRLGALHFQRAAMTQPIDYMADYRRHQEFLARRRSRRAARLGGIGQIAGMAVGALGSMIPGVGPILGPIAGNLVGGAITGFQSGTTAGSAGAQIAQNMGGQEAPGSSETGQTFFGSNQYQEVGQPSEGGQQQQGGEAVSAGAGYYQASPYMQKLQEILQALLAKDQAELASEAAGFFENVGGFIDDMFARVRL